ncbi:hypothetical protein CK203_032434 [Vitis vinifera]|uniref:Uncharacterized protein n=1 Tax=Vitis vinifera TaxID=29760 RepID=A0A438I6L4_VITVI|nr:hypothetical protein CK203_032434 [Vitis vinifera]
MPFFRPNSCFTDATMPCKKYWGLNMPKICFMNQKLCEFCTARPFLNSSLLWEWFPPNCISLPSLSGIGGSNFPNDWLDESQMNCSSKFWIEGQRKNSTIRFWQTFFSQILNSIIGGIVQANRCSKL